MRLGRLIMRRKKRLRLIDGGGLGAYRTQVGFTIRLAELSDLKIMVLLMFNGHQGRNRNYSENPAIY
jgi:hypothetical protein